MPTPVYGIFEGGGAKGLGHVAALKAAERNDLEFIGVAGASAGALIASLAAVGYRADELFDPNTPLSNLLSRYGISPLGLLGEREWARFELAGRKASGTAKAAAVAGLPGAWLWSRKSVAVAAEVRASGGYFSTERIRTALNGFLRARLLQHHADAGRRVAVPDRVRFRDIDPGTAPECCSLKVIATDVTNRRMAVFGGSADTADVEVAEAVAASISIPGVFKPARIPSYALGRDALYADGGLVSNLPVWVFAEEKLSFERESLPGGKVSTLAFSLADEDDAPLAALRPDSLGYWSAVARSAVFGGQSVARRFTSDLCQVAMRVPLGVAEFDLSLARALDGYARAYADAAFVIVREMRLRPAARARKLAEFCAGAVALFADRPSGRGVIDLRASLIAAGATSFRVIQAHRMDADADDRLVFSSLMRGAPAAFDSRQPAYVDFAAMRHSGIAPHMTKYERALLPRSLESAICLPIFDDAASWQMPLDRRPQPLGVVSIDSTCSLDQVFADERAMETLATLSLALAEPMKP